VIVTEQLKLPVAETIAPQCVMLAPGPIDVVTVTPGVNPLPVSVGVTPLGPWDGDSVIPAAVIV